MKLPDLQVYGKTGRALETGGPGVWVNYQTDGGEPAACFGGEDNTRSTRT